MQISKFEMGKADTGNAEVQPVRNNPMLKADRGLKCPLFSFNNAK